jgi:hypothetical protein
MGFGSWLSKHVFKPSQRFIGKAVKGVTAAARFVGKKVLPIINKGSGIIRDVAANPLAQAAIGSVLGPEAMLAMNGISAGAAFVNSASRAAPHIVNGFHNLTPQGATKSVQDLATLQQQYKNLKR